MGEGLKRARAAALRTQPLTDNRRRVLEALAGWKWEWLPTAGDIADNCGKRGRAYWARDPLLWLEAAGLVEKMGVAGNNNARTWRITDAGREALVTGGGR